MSSVLASDQLVVQVARLKPGATVQAASSSATQHAQAAAGTPGASDGRGFTQNQLDALRNQIVAFRRTKVSTFSSNNTSRVPEQAFAVLLLSAVALTQSFGQCHSRSSTSSRSWAA